MKWEILNIMTCQAGHTNWSKFFPADAALVCHREVGAPRESRAVSLLYVRTLTYCRELWVVTERVRLQIQVAE